MVQSGEDQLIQQVSEKLMRHNSLRHSMAARSIPGARRLRMPQTPRNT
jgi:hypothetical protein